MNINLLPWREQSRQRRCRILCWAIAASAGLVLLPAAGLMYWGKAQLTALERATELQRQRIAAVQEMDALLAGDEQVRQATRQQRKVMADWHQMRLDQLDALMRLSELASTSISIERVQMSPLMLTLDGQSRTASQLALTLEQLESGGRQSLQSPATQNLVLDDKGERYRYRVGIPWRAAPLQLPGAEAL